MGRDIYMGPDGCCGMGVSLFLPRINNLSNNEKLEKQAENSITRPETT